MVALGEGKVCFAFRARGARFADIKCRRGKIFIGLIELFVRVTHFFQSVCVIAARSFLSVFRRLKGGAQLLGALFCVGKSRRCTVKCNLRRTVPYLRRPTGIRGGCRPGCRLLLRGECIESLLELLHQRVIIARFLCGIRNTAAHLIGGDEEFYRIVSARRPCGCGTCSFRRSLCRIIFCLRRFELGSIALCFPAAYRRLCGAHGDHVFRLFNTLTRIGCAHPRIGECCLRIFMLVLGSGNLFIRRFHIVLCRTQILLRLMQIGNGGAMILHFLCSGAQAVELALHIVQNIHSPDGRRLQKNTQDAERSEQRLIFIIASLHTRSSPSLFPQSSRESRVSIPFGGR